MVMRCSVLMLGLLHFGFKKNGENVCGCGGCGVSFRRLQGLFTAVPKHITEVFSPMIAK